MECLVTITSRADIFTILFSQITPIPLEGRALRENGKMVFANITNNNFLPELFTNVAEKWIRNANPNNPFFLYFATPAVHTAFEPYGAVLHTVSIAFTAPKKFIRRQITNEKDLITLSLDAGISASPTMLFFH